MRALDAYRRRPPRPLRGGAWLTCSLMRDWSDGFPMRLTVWYEEGGLGWLEEEAAEIRAKWSNSQPVTSWSMSMALSREKRVSPGSHD